MRGTRTLAAVVGLALLRGSALAQSNECLVSLAATADNATTTRGGAAVTATADASGFCTFAVTACLDDTAPAACTPGTINRLRVLRAANQKDLAALQQTLQAQLPASQRSCTTTSIKVGQTRYKRVAIAATTADHRGDLDSVLLTCQCPGSAPSFRSTFEAIQKNIFENHGCTQQVCHGSSKQGGLDLSPDVAYQNLFEAPSTESSFLRVQPGDKARSMLWLKLAAKTDPTQLPPGVEVPGAPMPNNLPGLSKDELELVRLWIYAGAPQSGTVAGTHCSVDGSPVAGEVGVLSGKEEGIFDRGGKLQDGIESTGGNIAVGTARIRIGLPVVGCAIDELRAQIFERKRKDLAEFHAGRIAHLFARQ